MLSTLLTAGAALVGVVVGAIVTGRVQIVTTRQIIMTQARLIVADRRLQAHQEAYTLWRKLVKHLHSEDIGTVVVECQDWWENNRLYLSHRSRNAFITAYQNAAFDDDLRGGDSDLLRENRIEIFQAGEEIIASVNLPSLGEKEAKIV